MIFSGTFAVKITWVWCWESFSSQNFCLNGKKSISATIKNNVQVTINITKDMEVWNNTIIF